MIILKSDNTKWKRKPAFNKQTIYKDDNGPFIKHILLTDMLWYTLKHFVGDWGLTTLSSLSFEKKFLQMPKIWNFRETTPDHNKEIYVSQVLVIPIVPYWWSQLVILCLQGPISEPISKFHVVFYDHHFQRVSESQAASDDFLRFKKIDWRSYCVIIIAEAIAMVFLGVNVYTTDRSGCKSLRLVIFLSVWW